MEGLIGHEIPHQFIKEQEVEQAYDYVVVEREHQVIGVLENRIMLQQQTQEEGEVYGEDDLLDHERNNAANAYILNLDTTIIFLKKRVGNSHNVLKPAKDQEQINMAPLDVPIGDPQDVVGREMRGFQDHNGLKPYDSNLRKLDYEDYYKVAKEDEHHTLYLMVLSLQTKEERPLESTSSLNPQPLIPLEMLHWSLYSIPSDQFHQCEEQRRLYASP